MNRNKEGQSRRAYDAQTTPDFNAILTDVDREPSVADTILEKGKARRREILYESLTDEQKSIVTLAKDFVAMFSIVKGEIEDIERLEIRDKEWELAHKPKITLSKRLRHKK